MKSTRKIGKAASAEKIARLAERGEDISRFFTNTGNRSAFTIQPLLTIIYKNKCWEALFCSQIG